MLRRRALDPALLLLLLVAACFDEAPRTMSDPIDECRACQAEKCVTYAQSCKDTPDCDLCVAQPFNPGCLSSGVFRPLAFCSCEDCAAECGYMCPGGGAACRNCQGASGCDNQPCLEAPENACFPCVGDPYAEGCAENPEFMVLQECHCGGECEPACVWQCEGAAPACAACMTSACGPQFNPCLGDPECDECFNNPSTPGCQETDEGPGNALYQALGDCVCVSCPAECGLLFGC